jgi:hypothetical protein
MIAFTGRIENLATNAALAEIGFTLIDYENVPARICGNKRGRRRRSLRRRLRDFA